MKGDVTFARERFTDVLFSEMMPLLERHWTEVAHYPDIPLAVDMSVYERAESNDALRIFTVREPLTPSDAFMMGHLFPDGLLVGYAVYFVRANPHYASSVQAVQDVIYVSPSCRGRTGGMLIAYADQELAAEGVQAVYHHVKTAHNWGKLLERMGYEAVDVIYAKRLDR